MDDLAFLDATTIADLVRTGQISAAESIDAAIARVEAVNPAINAVIHPLFDQARARVARTDVSGPFAGVPIVVKDLDGALADAPNHRGNQLLQKVGYRDDHDSFLNARLKRAGFVPIGRSNTPEFGLQPTTEPATYGATHNPWNTEHSPGGSSGGSAAAVASGMVAVGQGGDGGGSIRIPSSACGLFGLKPSRGRVSLGPDQAESWHGLVQRHVMTRSVRDSAAVLDVLAGPEVGDPYTAPPPARPFADALRADPPRLRIAMTLSPIGDMCEVDPGCIAAARDAAGLLESLGHTVEEVQPEAYGNPGASFAEWWITLLSSWIAAEVDDVSRIAGRSADDSVEPNTAVYLELGRATSAPAYISAVTNLQRWAREAMAFFDTSTRTPTSGFDILLTPTLACPPVPLGLLRSTSENVDESAARAIPMAAFCAPVNITGQPAMSVPLYWHARSNLPIGVQCVGPMFGEALLLALAGQLERARPWAQRRPAVHA